MGGNVAPCQQLDSQLLGLFMGEVVNAWRLECWKGESGVVRWPRMMHGTARRWYPVCGVGVAVSFMPWIDRCIVYRNIDIELYHCWNHDWNGKCLIEWYPPCMADRPPLLSAKRFEHGKEE